MSRGARSRLRNAQIVLLLGCALILRALVPAGWMPAAGHGFAIEICADGANGAEALRFAEVARRQFQERLGPAAPHQRDGSGEQDHAGKDQPCTFAGLAMPWTGTEAPVINLPALAAPVLRSAPAAVAIGRGLAAPPPPSTGPPLFA